MELAAPYAWSRITPDWGKPEAVQKKKRSYMTFHRVENFRNK